LHIGLLSADLAHRHGWGSYSLSLVQALRDAGARLTVLAAHNSPPLDGVTMLPVLPTVDPRERGFTFKLARALPHARAALRDCDVIHATAEPYAPLAAALAGKRPLFVTGHGSYVNAPRAWRTPTNRLYAWAFRQATLVCVSRYTAGVAQLSVPGVRTVVVNNGVDAGRFTKLPPLETSKCGPTVLFVGAVKARKGVLELVRAMSVVRAQIPDVQCIVVGSLTAEISYAVRVRTEIAVLKLEDCVHLLGQTPEPLMMAWYGAADVFVLPSMNDGWKFEGYGLSLIEASAAGLPVIGTLGCGAEDAVDDGVTGLLIPQPSIAEHLPEAIISLLNNPARAAKMGAAGQAKAQRQSWDAVAARMIEIYGAKT
jgi:glycosyltransferase involved in cell wall biosynthesis